MHFFRFSIVLFLMISGIHSFAQESLTLEECIQMAQENSPEARIAKKAFETVYWSYRSYKAGLLPQVSLNVNSPGIVRSIVPVILDDGTSSFLQQNQAYSSANLMISQQIAPTGGSIFVSSGLNRIDVFGNNPYMQYQSTPMLIGFNQPILGYNQLKWDRRTQPLRYRLAEKKYLEALEQIAVTITGKYFDIYISQITLANSRSNETINDSIYTISKGRYNLGKIAENDLLQTELAWLNAKNAVRQSQLSLDKAITELVISLGLPEGTWIEVTPPAEVPDVSIDPDFALSQATQNRSNWIDFDIREITAQSNVAQARAQSRFNANLNASFGLNQAGTSLGNAYTNALNQETVTMSIGIPILQWGRGKARVESSLVDQERVNDQIQLEKRQMEKDVRFQVFDFLQLQQQVRLSAKADTIAQRRFLVAKNRYLIGKIDITNLLIAQTEKDNARAAYIRQLKSFWMAYYQLRASTLYDFIRDEPLVIPELSVE